MDRVCFRHSGRGCRSVRGDLIRQAQRALQQSGHDCGPLDGIFGPRTEAAVRAYQHARGWTENGEMTVRLWTTLCGGNAPLLFDRCLQLTSDFEGHGADQARGNWDGAGITWGLLGFTLASGSLGRVLHRIRTEAPEAYAAALGAQATLLNAAIALPAAARLRWADGISLPPDKYRLRPEWAAAFARLGATEAAGRAQRAEARRYWEAARVMTTRWGMETERGAALCFDIAVQNGGIRVAAARRIAEAASKPLPDRLLAAAEAVAEASRPGYSEDVRARKRTIALGTGEVHGAHYRVCDWGISMHPITALAWSTS